MRELVLGGVEAAVVLDVIAVAVIAEGQYVFFFEVDMLKFCFFIFFLHCL